MTRNEVVKRFCELSSKVGAQHFHHDFSYDCFCEDSTAHPALFSFDEAVMKFVEDAVNEKMAKSS